MQSTREKKRRRTLNFGIREVLETAIAAVIFGSIVAVVIYPVTSAVGPWIA